MIDDRLIRFHHNNVIEDISSYLPLFWITILVTTNSNSKKLLNSSKHLVFEQNNFYLKPLM